MEFLTALLSPETLREPRSCETHKSNSRAFAVLNSAEAKKEIATVEVRDAVYGTSGQMQFTVQNAVFSKKSRRASIACQLIALLWLSWCASAGGLDKNKGDSSINFTVAVVSHRPLKKCLLGVINEDICVHFVQPISKTCPPGYHQKFVGDSTPKCAKVNYAQKLLGCPPQEEMVEGLCIREIGYVCRKGHLDERNRCVLKQVLPPILRCPPGYKVIDDVCVLHRAISCADTNASDSLRASSGSLREAAGFSIQDKKHPSALYQDTSNSIHNKESAVSVGGQQSLHSRDFSEASHPMIHSPVFPNAYDGGEGRLGQSHVFVESPTLGRHQMDVSHHSDGYVALEALPVLSHVKRPNHEAYGPNYGNASEKSNGQFGNIFHAGAQTANGEGVTQYDIPPQGPLHNSHHRQPSHSIYEASRVYPLPQEDEFPSLLSLPVDTKNHQKYDQRGNSLLPLISSSQETYIPTVSLHDSSSSLLLPDAPYLTEDSEWVQNAQMISPTVAFSSAPLFPSSSRGGGLLHAKEASPRFLATAGRRFSHSDGKNTYSEAAPTNPRHASFSQAEGRDISKQEIRREDSLFLGKRSRKVGESGPRRLLGGMTDTASNLVDHCYEASRGCPFDFTLEIFKDDSIKSPVLVCMGMRVLPSEAVCAGRVVGSRCLVETKSHAKWFCPLDVLVDDENDAKKKKRYELLRERLSCVLDFHVCLHPIPAASTKPDECKKTPGLPTPLEAGNEGSSKQEQTKKGTNPRSSSAATETDSSATALGPSITPRYAQVTNSTDSISKREEATADDQKEREDGRARHQRHRQLERAGKEGANIEDRDSLSPKPDSLLVNQSEEVELGREQFRQLGKLPFALLIMEINERRKVTDPKQRMKDEVEKMNTAGKNGVDAAHHPPAPALLPPLHSSPGEKDGKLLKDLRTKKLSDPPEPPPTGLCYREQLVDQIIVCPQGYNITAAQVCQATSEPVVTCQAGVCVQYVYAELVDILDLRPPSEEKPKIIDKLKKSKNA
uniref:Uncharacterized protein NCLIV_069935 n=1 Tax=Neospora caninum (strain Liverpool) TaxID=572307 RepID=F0JB80_NEOCL|nr:unnamed protein product [Neospora caninum Liverpool]CEL71347.1 TPA: unnamed protein product [Neospora caninum Liverpool]